MIPEGLRLRLETGMTFPFLLECQKNLFSKNEFKKRYKLKEEYFSERPEYQIRENACEISRKNCRAIKFFLESTN